MFVHARGHTGVMNTLGIHTQESKGTGVGSPNSGV